VARLVGRFDSIAAHVEESLLSCAFRAWRQRIRCVALLPLETARDCPARPQTSPHASPRRHAAGTATRRARGISWSTSRLSRGQGDWRPRRVETDHLRRSNSGPPERPVFLDPGVTWVRFAQQGAREGGRRCGGRTPGAPSGSKLDPFNDEIHRLLKTDPKLPGQRVCELIAQAGLRRLSARRSQPSLVGA
jgi:hypothetical protein